MGSELKWYRNTMDSLNAFLATHEIPYEMRCRFREYFQRTQHMHNSQERKKLMKLMSPQLVKELSWQLNHKWIAKIPFLQNVEYELLCGIWSRSPGLCPFSVPRSTRLLLVMLTRRAEPAFSTA